MGTQLNGLGDRSARVAICYLAFDRDRLVRLTLDRVLRHKPPGWTLRVWQDGHRERHSGRIVGNPERIARNLWFFEQRKVDFRYDAGVNKGTAATYWEAECWAFETMDADFCIFIEDDIVISKAFFAASEALARIALSNPRIGAFSAFGDASLSWFSQWRGRTRLQPMHHRWAYGITRDYWRRTRADYRAYLELTETTDYRNRPNEAIRAWMEELDPHGAANHITSQDGARLAIMLKLGCFSIMTTPSYAVNIGKRGVHAYPAFHHANKARIKGPHPFFPWAVALPQQLSRNAAARLTRETREMAYW